MIYLYNYNGNAIIIKCNSQDLFWQSVTIGQKTSDVCSEVTQLSSFSQPTEICPNAGLLIVICTTACPMCASTQFLMTGLLGNFTSWSVQFLKP